MGGSSPGGYSLGVFSGEVNLQGGYLRHSPGPEKLGAPDLLETLALYSYMTFENAKVAKIGKGVFFSD